MGKTIKKISNVVLPNLGVVGGAVNGLVQGQGLKGALKGGLQGGINAAAQIGGSYLGANVLPATWGSTLGSSVGNVLGKTISNTAIGSTLGGFAGNAVAGSIGDSLGLGMDVDSAPKQKEAPGFEATRNAQIDLPGSLTNLQGLDDIQQSSNLANQGVYGGGLGKDEQAYYTNLINRRLVDDAGTVDSDLSEITPIDQSYLSQIGLGGYQDSKSLLEALSKWKAV